ncbi:MAG TPA: hypothetical protein VHM90_15060 [Phycisphaerae bacterium]|nr:hypothetical protein [Phycisphaerae bacterium]
MAIHWAILVVLGVAILASLVMAIFFGKHGRTPPYYARHMGWRLGVQGIWLAGLCLAVGVPVAIFWVVKMPHGGMMMPIVLRQALPALLIAGPAALLLARGNVDFSIGASMAAAGTCFSAGAANGSTAGGVLAALACVVGIGIANGAIVAISRVHSALVTIGMVAVVRAIVFAAQEGRGMVVFDQLPAGAEGTFRAAGWCALGLGVVAMIALAEATPMGRMGLLEPWEETWGQRLLFVGVPFVFSSVAAGIAGIVMAVEYRVASPLAGEGRELDALIAAALGGTFYKARNVGIVGALVAAFLVVIFQSEIFIGNASPQLMRLYAGVGVVAFILVGMQFHNLVAWWYHRRSARRREGFPVETGAAAAG